ncbi:MAG: response regulator [Anaerolineae bacterium]|nr:response regulator [Anaerolineae bacterium]
MVKILVIEDNRDNLDLVVFLLQRAGHEVLSASDGSRGLQAVAEHMPDLVLLDMALPEIDGWTAAEKLKEDPKTKNIPIVALTAHTLPGDRKRAINAGCDGYIAKPINVATFTDEVAEFINPAGENV